MTEVLPCPANDNRELKDEWVTPAEMLQDLKWCRESLIRDYLHDTTLPFGPFHQEWVEINACEACLRWWYFRD